MPSSSAKFKKCQRYCTKIQRKIPASHGGQRNLKSWKERQERQGFSFFRARVDYASFLRVCSFNWRSVIYKKRVDLIQQYQEERPIFVVSMSQLYFLNSHLEGQSLWTKMKKWSFENPVFPASVSHGFAFESWQPGGMIDERVSKFSPQRKPE